jgi:hypothetical protein
MPDFRIGSIASFPNIPLKSAFRVISDVLTQSTPPSDPRASGMAGVSFTGQSIGGRNSDT